MRPRHWGQHFLIDSRILDAMMGAVRLTANDTVLEIGPGKGALTARLLSSGAQVIAIERDRRLAAFVQQRFGHLPRFTLVLGDAVGLDWNTLGLCDRRYAVVANIPYSITTPLIEKFLEAPRPAWAELMIQRDVALRLTAQAGDGQRGALSVIVQEEFEIKSILSVPHGAFDPPPQVESAVILLKPRFRHSADAQFYRFIRDCFRHRRKMLVSALKALDRQGDWPAFLGRLGLPMAARPQELSNAQWEQLYRQYESNRISSK